MRSRALSCALLVVATACATTPDLEPIRPRANPGARARYACQKMADDLRDARHSARILAVAGETGRLYADDESLEPLERCLDKLHGKDAPSARVVAHAMGAVVRESRLFAPDERVELLRALPQPDIRAFWTAWILLDDERGAEAAAAIAAAPASTFRPLLLARAEAELARGDAEAAELALAEAGAADKPGLALELGVAIAREQLVRADRALAAWKVAGPWEPAKNDPDALAILAVPEDAPEDDACKHGELRLRRGDLEGALERLQVGGCHQPITRALLDDGRPFDALIHLRSHGVDDAALTAKVYAALGQAPDARATLVAAHARCLRLGSEDACKHLDADAAGYPAARAAPAAVDPPFAPAEAEPGEAPVAIPREELGDLQGDDVVLAVRERGRALVVVASPRAPQGLYAFLLEGKRRRGPYHLGLIPGGRYALVEEPTIKVFVKGGFQLEARDKQGGLATLRFDTRALTRDRDRDGWTDVLEGHLGTAADARDSDGDGKPDPRDPLPLQKPAAGDAGDALLKAALPALFDDAPDARLPEVVYLESSAQLLTGAGLSRPVIALPKAALARVPGALVFAALPAVALDRDKKRGMVEIQRDWRAVRTVYERDGDAWRALPSALPSGPSSGNPEP
jgi:hypothetical protein